ncbi:MAG: hypothetical protein ABW151_04940, partial [Pseudorhodoplanes sp.]
MKQALIFAALSAVLAAPVSGSAQAQGLPQAAPGMAADLLPPHEVTTVIASMGMRPLSRPIWRGDRYVVFAIDRHGQEVRVVLDAHNGQVLAVRPATRGFAQGNGARPFGGDQGYAPPPPPGYPSARPAPYDPRYGAPPPPPGAIPGAPPADDEEYFDNDRQQGSLPPPPAGPRATSREAVSRDGALGNQPTGSAPRRVTAVAPKDKSAKDTNAKDTPGKDAQARDVTPVPRPRPELAKADDPNMNGAKPDGAKPHGAKPAQAKPFAVRPAEAKPNLAPTAAAPQNADKP